MKTARLTCTLIRVGVLGQVDLQRAARARFSPALRLLLLASIVVVTVLTLAADLEAGAAAVALLTGLPQGWLVVPLALVLLAFLALGSFAGIQRVLKYLALALLAYVASALLTHVDWGLVLHHSFIPTFAFTHDYIAGGLAIVGTTLTSYVYVWQSVQLAEARPPSAGSSSSRPARPSVCITTRSRPLRTRRARSPRSQDRRRASCSGSGCWLRR